MSPREIQRRASYRMRRKCILEREPSTPCTFVIHETALHILVQVSTELVQDSGVGLQA
jgi:hypothetical protein